MHSCLSAFRSTWSDLLLIVAQETSSLSSIGWRTGVFVPIMSTCLKGRRIRQLPQLSPNSACGYDVQLPLPHHCCAVLSSAPSCSSTSTNRSESDPHLVVAVILVEVDRQFGVDQEARAGAWQLPGTNCIQHRGQASQIFGLRLLTKIMLHHFAGLRVPVVYYNCALQEQHHATTIYYSPISARKLG